MDTSWALGDDLTLDTTWRIQPALSEDVTWQMVETLSLDATWQIKKSPNVSTSWKIIETDGDIPGINSHVVSVTAGGTPIDPKSISLKTDLDSLAWSASLVLSTQADYDLCTDGESIVITIDGMVWYLDINERGASEVFIEDGWRVSAVSEFATVFDEPINLVLTQDTLASDIASTIADVTWKAVNWTLPEGLKIAENATRRSVLGDLAQAIGATIASTPYGALEVLPGTPKEDIYQAEWDEAEVISTDITTTAQEAYTRVLAGSEGLHIPREISINVLSQDDVARTATLGVWVTPPIPPVISCCGGLTITQNRSHSDSKTETVIFQDGVGSLSNVESITSVNWGSCTDLGNVTISNGMLIADTSGDSMAEVTYITLYYEYMAVASGTDELNTMVCATVDSLRSNIIADCQRGSSPFDLSPDVLTNRLCTTIEAAAERGRVYLDRHSGDNVVYNVSKVWGGEKLPEIGALIDYRGEKVRLSSIDINYEFPAVSMSASLEVI